MKNFLLACLAFCAFAPIANATDFKLKPQASPPPSNLIYSGLYVPATHTVAPVLGYRVTTIGNLFNVKGLSPDLFILGGYDVVKSKVTGGFVLMFTRPIASNVTASFGPGVATTTDGKPHFALCGSINIRT